MNQARPPLLKHVFSWLILFVLYLLAQMPYRFLLWLGKGIGYVLKTALRSRKKVVEKNIKACFTELDDAQQQKLVAQNFIETGMMVSQTLKAFLGQSNRLLDQLQIRGAEHLQKCLDEKQGVLLVSGHFTALDIGGKAICRRFPVAGVYRPHKNPVVEYAVKKSRLKYATKMFARDELKGIIGHLKSAGIVWYAPDQNYRRGSSVFSPFFNIPAATITATHQLAKIAKCKIIYLAVKRVDKKPYYELSLSAPMENFPSKDAQADTDQVNLNIEKMVRNAPAQYLWIHKRFKTRPKGESPFY